MLLLSSRRSIVLLLSLWLTYSLTSHLSPPLPLQCVSIISLTILQHSRCPPCSHPLNFPHLSSVLLNPSLPRSLFLSLPRGFSKPLCALSQAEGQFLHTPLPPDQLITEPKHPLPVTLLQTESGMKSGREKVEESDKERERDTFLSTFSYVILLY